MIAFLTDKQRRSGSVRAPSYVDEYQRVFTICQGTGVDLHADGGTQRTDMGKTATFFGITDISRALIDGPIWGFKLSDNPILVDPKVIVSIDEHPIYRKRMITPCHSAKRVGHRWSNYMAKSAIFPRNSGIHCCSLDGTPYFLAPGKPQPVSTLVNRTLSGRNWRRSCTLQPCACRIPRMTGRQARVGHLD